MGVRAVVATISASIALAAPAAAPAEVTEVPLNAGARFEGVTTGPDGNLWVTAAETSRILRVTPQGTVTAFTLPAGRGPHDITTLGGLLYFTERAGDRLGRLNPGAGDDAAIQVSIVEFAIPGAGSRPTGITAGPDGNIWITETGSDQIARVTPAGVVVEYGLMDLGSRPSDITTGPDGNLWFTAPGTGQVGRMTTAGTYVAFDLPEIGTLASAPYAIAPGPANALWVADGGLDQVRLVSTGGTVTSSFPAPSGSGLSGITQGSDGAAWTTAGRSGELVRVTAAGGVARYAVPNRGSAPAAITTGPDGALWFTQAAGPALGRITVDTAPDALPTGPAGATGPAGPPGPPGATGAAGAAARLVLVAYQATPARPRAGRRVSVRFALTGPARTTLSVRRAGTRAERRVAVRQVRAAGRANLSWNGRLGRTRARRGTYDLIVRATAGGTTVTSRLRIRLR